MSEIPKIDFSELKRTHLGFPSEWKINNIRIHYRQGKLSIYVDESLKLTTGKYWDEFDLNGYMEDDELKKILAYHDLLR